MGNLGFLLHGLNVFIYAWSLKPGNGFFLAVSAVSQNKTTV